MTQKTFVIDLGKLMISAAWADGKLAIDEINALKDLLFNLDDVSAEDWAVLEMYMDFPVTESEHKELLNRVIKGIKTHEDKEFVVGMLQRLFSADGEVTTEEAELMKELESEILQVDTNVFAKFSGALKSAIQQRKSTVRSTCLRENDVEDYTKNIIYYDLQRKQEESGTSFDQPDAQLRKISFAAGLLAYVANIDADMSADEKDAMREIIVSDWNLSEQQADLIVQISCERTAKGLDYFRLTHGFFEVTTVEDRKAFLKTLFKIANAANETSNDEIETIRRVAKSLKVSHKDFIDAKLTIPRKDRKGF